MRFYIWLLLLVLAGNTSCALTRKKEAKNGQVIKREIAQSAPFSRAHSGFILMDAGSGKPLAALNAQHLFTPASNIKILTLASCLEILSDTLPGLKVARTEDQRWIIRGTGDPTFLHPNYQAWQQPFNWMKSQSAPIILQRQYVPRFGPGWSWDDYLETYSTERSDFPFYGNMVEFKKEKGQWTSTPKDLNLTDYDPYNVLYPETKGVFRVEYFPYYLLSQPDSTYTDGYTDRVPFSDMSIEDGFLATFLPDTLGKKINQCFRNFPESCQTSVAGPWTTIPSAPRDTVLRQMMFESDNLLAEQLLMVCADQKYDALLPEFVIEDMLTGTFSDIYPKPRWVDGSGLSRYNLISPEGMALALRRLWSAYDHDRILSFFPTPGSPGTLSKWPKDASGATFWYGKTGSMSGVMCLSGYVRGKSGRMMVFSFMHNHFTGSNQSIKDEMQRILQLIHEKF
ncbi:MAG: D-alanyl-D-alanine carboxypeptidase [Saprospiraceae bacterium]|nr:D-alanyl-D-alanine carboxypeptidase [Saprospiraceae bacterium]